MTDTLLRIRQLPAGGARSQVVASSAAQRRRVGLSDLHVSPLCLGTMLFGEDTTAPSAHDLLHRATERGVNFFDTAEMYPVPQSSATAGRSEAILGDWLRTRRRSDFVVATKVAGPGGMGWLRGGPAALDAANILAAIDGSLRRLRTDHIDLIQLHWPDRYVPMFGEVDYDPTAAYASCPVEEQLEALGRAVAAGKARWVGLSNETPYGLMRFCGAAGPSAPGLGGDGGSRGGGGGGGGGSSGLPRIVSLQNAYSLTCRTFDAGLAECCHAERVSLLAYSPLAMGLLTGKYMQPGGGPREARLNKYRGRYAEAESRYGPKPNVYRAVAAYVDIARRWGISPVELALRFVLSHPLVAAAVTGATSAAQLDELTEAAEAPPLEPELRAEVDAVHAGLPSPTP